MYESIGSWEDKSWEDKSWEDITVDVRKENLMSGMKT
jgi:hypothetical protein